MGSSLSCAGRGVAGSKQQDNMEICRQRVGNSKPAGLSAAALAAHTAGFADLANGRKSSKDSDRMLPPDSRTVPRPASPLGASPAGTAAAAAAAALTAGARGGQLAQGEQADSSAQKPAAGKPVPQAQMGRADSAHLGSPYEQHFLGPPVPPCNDERLETLHALQQVDEPPDPEISHIVSLICNVFKTNAALVALVEDGRIYIRNSQGFQRGDFPWRWSFCAWTLAPKHGQCLVVEDALEDSRFADNQFVLGEPHVRAYIGTPLIASDGHRLGTLCFVDQKPRKMDAEQCQILNNMAELCVREIEKGAKLHKHHKKSQALQQVNAGLLRAMDCFQDSIMFVDTSSERWQILHTNEAWSRVVETDRQSALTTTFWDLFALPAGEGSDKPWEQLREKCLAGRKFSILGCLLGKGSFGRVYRGMYNGKVVAVKVMDGNKEVKVDAAGVPLEVALTQHLAHPNVVATLHYQVVKPQGGEDRVFCSDSANASAEQKAVPPQTWLVLEHCDGGCLQDAVDKGFFRTNRSVLTGQPNLDVICPTALDIARGMAFLHAHNIIHGDLTGGNILLSSSSADPRGFCAKVADFGMARELQIKSRIETATYGTVTHMPPELLESGTMTKATDVFAFGVVLYELACSARAWAGLNHAQVISAVAVDKRSLVFPLSVPAEYAALAQRCMSRDAAERPTFDELCELLPGLQASLAARLAAVTPLLGSRD
ncbi:hypothetical protein WJX72_011761 [[Myrmecia] bisecta]|uniref:Protein kinase domain-containing protein n=1 Tax=[Myrmecia] bisecta TaxID=41462 RepID=A0AAW1QGM6_9CHLO